MNTEDKKYPILSVNRTFEHLLHIHQMAIFL